MRELDFGFSTCPNDTFSFHAAVHGLVSGPARLKPFLADVEELNQRALAGAQLPVTKLSCHALGHVLRDYVLLRSGAALGQGCGPLVVARPGFDPTRLGQVEVAVPGHHTTAHLLLSLFLGRPPLARPMLFSDIMPQVAAGEFEAGLIIHEGRFTYQHHGLEAILDLGQWWEGSTGLPIPLGCIAARRDLGPELIAGIQAMLAASLRHGWAHPLDSAAYVATHAQELEPQVTRQHIDLYVNHYSEDLGDDGLAAMREVLTRGRDCGLIPAWEGDLVLG